jgi:hypothetical protein
MESEKLKLEPDRLVEALLDEMPTKASKIN